MSFSTTINLGYETYKYEPEYFGINDIFAEDFQPFNPKPSTSADVSTAENAPLKKKSGGKRKRAAKTDAPPPLKRLKFNVPESDSEDIEIIIDSDDDEKKKRINILDIQIIKPQQITAEADDFSQSTLDGLDGTSSSQPEITVNPVEQAPNEEDDDAEEADFIALFGHIDWDAVEKEATDKLEKEQSRLQETMREKIRFRSERALVIRTLRMAGVRKIIPKCLDDKNFVHKALAQLKKFYNSLQ